MQNLQTDDNNLWESAPLTSICKKLRGVSYNKDEVTFIAESGYLPILRANNISDDELNYDDLVYVPPKRVSEQQLLKFGDVVIAMSSGSKLVVGKAAQLQKDWKGSFGAFCGVLRPLSDRVEPEFFGYFFSTKLYRSYISKISSGSNINNLKNEHFENIDFPLPSIDEQKKIISKLHDLLPRVKSNKQKISSAKNHIQQFRQSVLYAAVTGKLTETWREKNNQLKPVSNSVNKDIFTDSEINGWLKTEIGKLYHSFGGGTPSKSEPKYWNGDIQWVASGDVKNDYIETGSATITKKGLDSSSSKICSVGSIIVVVRSGILKHTLPVSIVRKDISINQDIKCFDSGNTDLNTWLFYFLRAMQNDILALNREGTTVQSVKYETLKNLEIEIPSFDEQREIAKRVKSMFEAADLVEKQIEKAGNKVDKLTQSILAKAFRGEL